jgi:exodeoxyribonuclease VII small subunit
MPEEKKEQSFEQAMARLAKIVEELEKGEKSLEDSLALFEEGVKLSRAAQSRLDLAQQKVEKLLGVDEKGKPRKVPFGDDDDPEI